MIMRPEIIVSILAGRKKKAESKKGDKVSSHGLALTRI
jgi:hypothetical protein